MTKKTDSIWDDLASLALNFLKNHWWKLAIVFIAAGIGVSTCSFKVGNVEFKKGQAPIDNIRK